MSCQGEPIEMKDLRTPEQQQIMQLLGGIIAGNIQAGATPYPGPRNAPPDIGQMSAMNTMMGIGGYGPYTYNPIPYGSQPPIGMMTPFPITPDNPATPEDESQAGGGSRGGDQVNPPWIPPERAGGGGGDKPPPWFPV